MKKRYVLRRAASAAAVVAALALAPGLVLAGGKVDICHVPPGNPENVRLINISEKAVPAHLAHGDVMPGDSIEGDSYGGLYGSSVTPVTLIGDDCGSTSVLEIVSPPMGFGSGGWGGWSCVEPGYQNVVGGGYLPEGASVLASGPAEPGGTVGGYTYPNFPHYTFPDGETGWVVQGAGSGNPTNVVVVCGE